MHELFNEYASELDIRKSESKDIPGLQSSECKC